MQGGRLNLTVEGKNTISMGATGGASTVKVTTHAADADSIRFAGGSGNVSLMAQRVEGTRIYKDDPSDTEPTKHTQYGVVNDGKWTIDNLTGLTSEIYEDLNANDKRDIEDFYGFATNPYSHINAYLWAFDNPVCAIDSEGNISVVIHTPKMAQILEKLVKITSEYTGTYYDPSYTSKTNLGAHGGPVDLFRSGNVIFANGLFEYAIYYFREVDDFGIIPYPKWDEAQEKYQMMVDGGHAAEAVPMTCADTERTGTILEALNAETYKTVVPAYYEIALKVKYARDNESIQMLDMIMANRVFDFGYVYDNWNGASFWLQDLVKGKKTDFESYYAKNESKVLKYYQKVFDRFDEYANG